MRRLVILAMLLALTPSVHAEERPTVAILPFGIAKDRGALRWLGFATASTLTESLRRVPTVRVVPFASVLHELRGAGLDPDQVAWTPAVALAPLGKWLQVDRVLLGAVGKTGDQKIANVILQAQEPPPPAKGTQIWLAARVIDIASGQSLGSAYVEGETDHILALQSELLDRLGDALNRGANNQQTRDIAHDELKIYQTLAEAEHLILEGAEETDARRKERTLKKARKRTESVLRRDPGSALAHSFQGTLYTLRNRPLAANAAFEAAIEKDPQFTTPYYGLANLAMLKDDLPGATSVMERLTQVAPWEDEAFHFLGSLFQLQNQPERALAAFENALTAYGRRPDTRYEAGRLYLSLGETRKAILALQKAVADMPGEPAYQIALADAQLADGDIARTRLLLDRMSPAFETDPEYLLVRGKLDLQTHQFDDARIHLEAARKAFPDRAAIHAHLGTTYKALGRLALARDAFLSAQSYGIALDQIALPFGDVLEALNQTTEAEDLYRMTLVQTPENSDLRLRLVKHLLNRQAVEEAIQTLETGLRSHPDRGDFHVMLADLYASQNENARAAKHYERALQLGVSTREVSAQLGQLYLGLDQPDRARTYFEQALHAGAMGAETYAGLGRAEELLGHQQAALNAFRQALKANPQHADAQSAVARLTLALRPKPRVPKAEDYARSAEAALVKGDVAGAQKS
ncbi:MAG: tetratricopeptide repeat protein, partial [bacterium]|nr:tetratricopeptide repeat protein [bacterium]